MKAPFPDATLPPLVIVDDSEDDVFLFRYRLREGGVTHPILTFSSGADALSYLVTTTGSGELPILLFTDIKMPGDSGFELIETIRSHPQWDGMQLAVATTSNDVSDLERALELGVNGYLIKIPPPELLAEFVLHGPWFAVQRRVHALSA